MRTGDKQEARSRILAAALELLRDQGTTRLTVDAVSKKAGCAKGLIHYHFKTKKGLLGAAASDFALRRRSAWKHAFETALPKDAIGRTWELLTRESTDGTARAWASLFVSGNLLPEQAVKQEAEDFSITLADSVAALMARAGMTPTVPRAEIGWLLGSIVNGMGLQLLTGGPERDLEGAYAAAWLGILSLFAPRAG